MTPTPEEFLEAMGMELAPINAGTQISPKTQVESCRAEFSPSASAAPFLPAEAVSDNTCGTGFRVAPGEGSIPSPHAPIPAEACTEVE